MNFKASRSEFQQAFKSFWKNLKAQGAIEYLLIIGGMILVVGIIAGVLISGSASAKDTVDPTFDGFDAAKDEADVNSSDTNTVVSLDCNNAIAGFLECYCENRNINTVVNNAYYDQPVVTCVDQGELVMNVCTEDMLQDISEEMFVCDEDNTVNNDFEELTQDCQDVISTYQICVADNIGDNPIASYVAENTVGTNTIDNICIAERDSAYDVCGDQIPAQ